MGELGTRRTTERVRVGHSPPKAARAVFLPDPRTLAVPAVRDRIAQAAVLNVIEPIFEAEFEDESFAYRKDRSVKLAALRIMEIRDQGYRYVVEADKMTPPII